MATKLKVVEDVAGVDQTTEGHIVPAPTIADFEIAPTRNQKAGWTAERQRKFIEHLSLTGSVGEAAGLVGVTSRSAYMLRNRAGAEGFARAWDSALQLAATRLAAIAFDRAVHGRSERFYRNGELVMERKMPSDYLLTWLLSRLDPLQFGSATAKALAAATGDPRKASRDRLPGLLDGLADIADEACPVESAEIIDERLGEMS
jgi:hypothetical protein